MCDRSPTTNAHRVSWLRGFQHSVPHSLSLGSPKIWISKCQNVSMSRDLCYSSECLWVFTFRDFAIPAATTPCPFELSVFEKMNYRSPKLRSSTPNMGSMTYRLSCSDGSDLFWVSWVKNLEFFPLVSLVAEILRYPYDRSLLFMVSRFKESWLELHWSLVLQTLDSSPITAMHPP